MARHAAVTLGYTRGVRTLDVWENDRTPEDGAPDRTDVRVFWLDADGRAVTDPDAIAELERRYQARLGEA